MPVTPREDTTGVRTRAQQAAEATATARQATLTDHRETPVGPAHQAASIDEAMSTGPEAPSAASQDLSTGPVHRATPSGHEARASAFDFCRLMQMMEYMRQGQEEMRQGQEEMRQSQEEMRQEMRQKQEEMRQGQDKMQGEIHQEQQRVLLAVGSVGDMVQNLQKNVDLVEERVTNLETNIDSVKTNLAGLQKKVLRLETAGPIASSASSDLVCTTRVPRVEVPSYDGTTSWAAYRQQFRTVAAANGWTEEQSLTALTVALRGSALSVLEALPSSGSTFKDLMEALEARYGEHHLEHVFRAQLRDRVQRSGEGLQQWALEIEKLVRKAYPSADIKMVESTILQSFVDGIRDMEIRAAVGLRHHASLKEALAHALEVELLFPDVRPIYKVQKFIE